MDIRNLKKTNAAGTIPTGPVTGMATSSGKYDTEPTKPEMTEEPSSSDTIKGTEIAEHRKFLEGQGIGTSEIMAVLDTIITTGNVFWQFKLFDRIEVVLQMRPAWVNDYLMYQLEQHRPQIYARYSSIVATYNLAGSLHKYAEQEFSLLPKGKTKEAPAKTKEDSLEEVAGFIQGLPFALQSQLIKQMAIFDRVIAVATSDWALENFT